MRRFPGSWRTFLESARAAVLWVLEGAARAGSKVQERHVPRQRRNALFELGA